MAWDSKDPGRLTYQEVRDALSQMSEVDLRRAERIASFLSQRLPGMNADDLLQEVYIQLLSGDRRFPRDVPALVVLKTAMRSEASNVRKAGRASPVDPLYQLESVDAPERRSPEVEFLAREELEAVLASCSGDPQVELVVLAWTDGLKGEAAREITGLDEMAFDAARKRATRKLAGFERAREGS
jgi:DNA-directed RNA polymerase specialized sigma24 family protein